MNLERDGWGLVDPRIPADLLAEARESLFDTGKAGSRCLLDVGIVRQLAVLVRDFLAARGILSPESVAIQAIAFDKTAGSNWKVPWHQDLMFPFARAVECAGYELATVKDGVSFARPPLAVLQRLLAARLHLDPCTEDNGPLRLAAGSHREGLIESVAAGARAREWGETVCSAKEGEVLLMRPLTLHASSQAKSPAHRRVLHFVFDEDGGHPDEAWHRTIG
jgi:ectoine hydroxylase-related dioxygenase (phytanoyl-CoA dioxygenase family)